MHGPAQSWSPRRGRPVGHGHGARHGHHGIDDAGVAVHRRDPRCGGAESGRGPHAARRGARHGRGPGGGACRSFGPWQDDGVTCPRPRLRVCLRRVGRHRGRWHGAAVSQAVVDHRGPRPPEGATQSGRARTTAGPRPTAAGGRPGADRARCGGRGAEGGEAGSRRGHRRPRRAGELSGTPAAPASDPVVARRRGGRRAPRHLQRRRYSRAGDRAARRSSAESRGGAG